MKEIFLIAWREYKQYVFSRGFLVFLVALPIGLIFMSAALSFLESNKPIRNFVVVDETGAYTDNIDREITRRHQFTVLYAWDAYLAASLRADLSDAEKPAAPFAAGRVNERRLQAFAKAGGFEAATAAVSDLLRPGVAPFAPPEPTLRRVDLPGDIDEKAGLAAVEANLRPYLMGDRAIEVDGAASTLFAAILIPEGFGANEGDPAAQYWSRNLTDTALENIVSMALDSALRRDVISSYGMSEEDLDAVVAIDAPVTAFRPDRAPGEAELSIRDRIETTLPAAMTYMLLVIIFGAGNLLLTNTIEERSSKIVETLLSSVTANQLMMGKLIGIGAVGLTMPSIFLVGGAAMAFASPPSDENIMQAGLEALFASNLLAVYLFYFLCAYLIFAMIFLAIGAVSNSLQDAQSYMGPVMLLVFAPLPLMLMIFQNPNGIAASVLTWIPIYTPYAVMMRAASDPPLWEVLGATALMLAFTIFLVRIMGRIFRNAILQAAPPKMKEVWRLAKADAA